jgi:hypothetical protein
MTEFCAESSVAEFPPRPPEGLAVHAAAGATREQLTRTVEFALANPDV